MVVLLVLNMPYEAGFSVLDIYSVFTVVKVEEWEGEGGAGEIKWI